MNAGRSTCQAIASTARNAARSWPAPLLIVMILAMMVLPLPPFLLDMLFTFNIALSIMVLLVAMYTMKPLDFSVFPTVLLMTTLLRLSLNVASTRVVLLQGHTGPDAAGKVIEAFGHFLVGGNYVVGIVVFVILVVINFVVITKGAGRIAEVGARFTLDAMPGKQMAIDADLNAGLIGEDEARKRRADDRPGGRLLRRDGRRLQVRARRCRRRHPHPGHQHRRRPGRRRRSSTTWTSATAAKNYTLLTIGDGLVAQIPALIISTAAGLVVTRVGDDDKDIGQQLVGQVFGNPTVLVLTAGILGILGLIPGMPQFRLPAARRRLRRPGLVDVASTARRGGRRRPRRRRRRPRAAEAPEASWDDVAPVDVLGLEVGYRLIPLVDKAQDGDLLKRISGLRKKFAQEIGFLSAPVHIRDNLELKPNAYRITLKGVEVGSGEAYPGMFLAINPGRVSGPLPGTPTKDPAFGLPAVWIEAGAARTGAGHGLHRGRCRHRGRDAPQPRHPVARRRTARPPGDAGAARPPRQGVAQAGRRPGAEAAAAGHAAERAAEPARRRRPHPRHAHHHRDAGRACAAHPGSARTRRARCASRSAAPSSSSSTRAAARCR